MLVDQPRLHWFCLLKSYKVGHNTHSNNVHSYEEHACLLPLKLLPAEHLFKIQIWLSPLFQFTTVLGWVLLTYYLITLGFYPNPPLPHVISYNHLERPPFN